MNWALSSQSDGRTIGDATAGELRSLINGRGVRLPLGPFSVLVRSHFDSVATLVHTLYADYPLAGCGEFADLRMTLARRLPTDALFGYAALMVDGETWARFPARMAPAYLEWGLNWAVYWRAYHGLVIHAATVERDGLALVMPAPSGSGKSTLCAALVHRGWRLLSDELAVVSLDTFELIPMVKPICLKEESIPVIGRFAPEAVFGPVMYDIEERRKVAHVRPPRSAILARRQRARARWIVFPRYIAAGTTSAAPVSKGAAFMRVVKSAFNYVELGKRGFDAMSGLIDECEPYELEFHDLNAAVERIDEITQACAAARCAG